MHHIAILETGSYISACADSPRQSCKSSKVWRLARMEAKWGVPVYQVSFSTPARIDCKSKTGQIFKTYLALVDSPELRCRELSRAGGTNGSTTPDTMQPMATARAARESGRGR